MVPLRNALSREPHAIDATACAPLPSTVSKPLAQTPRNTRTFQDFRLSWDARHSLKRPALLKEAAPDFCSRAAVVSIALHALELQ